MKYFVKISIVLLFLFAFVSPAYAAQTAKVLPALLRVGLEGEFKNLSRVSIGNTHLTVGYNVNGAFSPFQAVQSPEGFTLIVENNRMVLYAGSQAVLTLDDSLYAAQIKDGNGGNVTLGGKPYMNAIEFYRPAKTTFTAVNVLTPQEYLYSVVPSEMPVQFQLEALKAQSVAARSYLLTRMGIHATEGYDVCDQSHCMVYKGASQNSEASTRAVDETNGQVIYYQGQPINAVFFSSSGGVTDNAENVWTETVPYLRGVTDSIEFEPKVWTRSFTWPELTSLLIADNATIGTANDAAITKRGVGGRVLEFTVYATAGQKTFAKEEIRYFFSPSAGGTLESRNFNITGGGNAVLPGVAVTDGVSTRQEALSSLFVMRPGQTPLLMTVLPTILNAPQYAQTQQPLAQPVPAQPTGGVSAAGITLTGTGWGHGVGMSQRGAEGLARAGYTYRDILLHYYTGVDIY